MEMSIFIIIFFLGASIGSFLNVVAIRIQKEESFVSGASSCPKCGRRIKPWEMIPIISYFLIIRGKCRGCDSKVSLRYPLAEIICGILFLIVFSKFKMEYQTLYYWNFVAILFVVTLVDFDSKIIPDEFLIYGAITGIIMNYIFKFIEWKDILLGSLSGGGFFLAIFLFSLLVLKKEGMGFGDVKFMAMNGIYLGLLNNMFAGILSFYIGLLVVIPLLLMKKKGVGSEVPFGPFIAVASIVSFLFGKDIINWYLTMM